MYYEDKKHHLFQVAYDLDDLKTRERELKAIAEAAGELPDTENIILTYEEEEEIVYNGVEISVLPVWKWLLEEV